MPARHSSQQPNVTHCNRSVVLLEQCKSNRCVHKTKQNFAAWKIFQLREMCFNATASPMWLLLTRLTLSDQAAPTCVCRVADRPKRPETHTGQPPWGRHAQPPLTGAPRPWMWSLACCRRWATCCWCCLMLIQLSRGTCADRTTCCASLSSCRLWSLACCSSC